MRKLVGDCSPLEASEIVECSELEPVPWYWVSMVFGLCLAKLNTMCPGTMLTLFYWYTIEILKPVAFDVGVQCYLN